MAPNIRVSDGTNRRLKEIQTRLLRLTGAQVSKKELVDLILEVGPDVDRLAARLKGVRYPLPPAVRRRIRGPILDWGVITREEDINRVLYGWR